MNLTHKESHLLELFLDSEQPVSLKQLMLRLDISDKTLRSMVRKLNEELRDFDAEVVLKRGSGYMLEGGDKPAIRQAAEGAESSGQSLAVNVFQYMIDQQEYMTMEKICDSFFISKSKLNGL